MCSRATTRTHDFAELAILAIDHRTQFEELARDAGAPESRIAAFKALALRAVDRVAAGDRGFGVIVDDKHGFDTLARASDTPYWIGRPIESPRSRPVEFVSSADVATELVQWPLRHVVKCLVHYHADDEEELRARQERQVLRLFDACRKTGHELLLEVIVPPGAPVDDMTVARAIRRFYELGVRPDWWKLEPSASAAAWHNIERAVAEGDPWCRGVLLLGLAAPEDELIASFRAAAPFKVVKGFAVGRTIFNAVARDWLAGRSDDETAVAALAEKFASLVDAWREARAAVGAAA